MLVMWRFNSEHCCTLDSADLPVEWQGRCEVGVGLCEAGGTGAPPPPPHTPTEYQLVGY